MVAFRKSIAPSRLDEFFSEAVWKLHPHAEEPPKAASSKSAVADFGFIDRKSDKPDLRGEDGPQESANDALVVRDASHSRSLATCVASQRPMAGSSPGGDGAPMCFQTGSQKSGRAKLKEPERKVKLDLMRIGNHRLSARYILFTSIRMMVDENRFALNGSDPCWHNKPHMALRPSLLFQIDATAFGRNRINRHDLAPVKSTVRGRKYGITLGAYKPRHDVILSGSYRLGFRNCERDALRHFKRIDRLVLTVNVSKPAPVMELIFNWHSTSLQ
jgi:hypothetical protein